MRISVVLGGALAALIASAGAAAATEQEGAARFCNAAADGFEPEDGSDAAPREICIAIETYAPDVCAAIDHYATAYGLPPDFFARLIWQESRFRPNAVSPANAQGIAQFIPSTAELRGLSDPFNPSEALFRSAEYLAELAERFGSLGMAAVAYNAGEGRARNLLNGGTFAPLETRGYVAIITGKSIEDWLATPPPQVDYQLQPGVPFKDACLALATTQTYRRFTPPVGGGGGTGAAAIPAWGVQIAAHQNQSVAGRMFERVKRETGGLLSGEAMILVREGRRAGGLRRRYAARVGRPTREAALSLCQRLRSRGVACTVARN